MAQELLAGQVALVTGGSRGIGAAIARELAEAGATVALNYRSDEAAARRTLETLATPGSLWQADVADPGEAAALVAGVVERHGAVDALVANAGVWRGGRIEAVTDDDWRLVMNTTLGGTHNVVKAAISGMRERRHGRIVVISSSVGLTGFPGDTPYATAKAGVIGFVRALAKEVGRDNITVNAVAPGLVDTDMTATIPDRSRDAILSRTLLRRPGVAEDVAAATRFLIGEGHYITGHTLVVDGGGSL